ncbi:MAG TPA: glycerate kinase [Conexibacter sp.]|nr:glycerate kinase [Conexibacter sp.]
MSASTVRAPLLVAPAAFVGTLRAPEVAAALARGLEAGGWPVDPCPVADGGAGTLEALLPALGGETATVSVSGRDVGIGLVEGGRTAVVELRAATDRPGGDAVATGDAAALDQAGGSSAAIGELLLAADATGADLILAGAGDLVAPDGGAGAVETIGAGGGLRARLVVLCDVRTSVERVAEALAGAGELERERAKALGARLDALARRLPRDPRGVAHSGAGGGLAGALWATCDARLEGGAPFVLEQLDFDARMRGARAVIVGEGRLDLGTLAGKAPGEIATRARQSGVPCFAAVGARTLDAFGARILDLQAVLEAGDAGALETAGRRLATLV